MAACHVAEGGSGAGLEEQYFPSNDKAGLKSVQCAFLSPGLFSKNYSADSPVDKFTGWFAIPNAVFLYSKLTSMKILNLLCLLFFIQVAAAQRTDPEFPPGWIMHARLHNGLLTKMHSSTDRYAGGLQVLPQYTIVPHKLRTGITAGVFYADHKVQALAGPSLAWKIKTLHASFFGSAGNLHLSADHWWGTRGQFLAGGSLNLDIGNLLILGLSAHRDYRRGDWWLQQTLAVRISRKKVEKEPFN